MGGFELLDVRSVTTLGPASGPVRRVLVTVDARDRMSRAVMALRDRARLVRRDRWYVAELNTARDTMSLHRVTDGYLARRAATGDGAAFAELARRYRPLLDAAVARVPEGSDRDDARQEALLGLYVACRATDGRRPFAGIAKLNVRWRITIACRDAATLKHRVYPCPPRPGRR